MSYYLFTALISACLCTGIPSVEGEALLVSSNSRYVKNRTQKWPESWAAPPIRLSVIASEKYVHYVEQISTKKAPSHLKKIVKFISSRRFQRLPTMLEMVTLHRVLLRAPQAHQPVMTSSAETNPQRLPQEMLRSTGLATLSSIVPATLFLTLRLPYPRLLNL